MEMRLFYGIFTLLMMLSLSSAAQEEIRNCKPATIEKQGRRRIYFQQNGDAILDCKASGNETLKYSWLKDGVELDTSEERMSIKENSGTLVLSPALETDAGAYQCMIQNPCGTSLSHKINLLYSFIEPFTQEEAERVHPNVGQHLMLSCKPPASIPEATIRWILSSEEDSYDPMEYEQEDVDDRSKMFDSVELGRRITMDYDGNLHFVHVIKEDSQNGRHYVCMAVNNEVRSLNQGEDKIVDVLGTSSYEKGVQIRWQSPDKVQVLEGQKAKFKCIFSGYPMPTVLWRRIDDGRLDQQRMKQSTDKHEFVISDVKPGDAGTYECSAQSSEEIVRRTFTLSVEAFPKWDKRPQGVTKGVEDSVTFMCSADGSPEPDIQWFINGLPLEKAPPAKNRKLRNNALVFTNLTQDDSQVIQCNASNIHGYQWANAILEVEAMQPTILSKPTEQKVAEDRDIIAILLLILIIVCIVKRNRGKEYKFPPEKDTVDEGPGHFNEMAKSEKNGVNSSSSFERDPEKVPLEDETDSLEDYGDVDPTKFNEDGSFIGQYGDTKPDAPNPSAMSSIV